MCVCVWPAKPNLFPWTTEPCTCRAGIDLKHAIPNFYVDASRTNGDSYIPSMLGKHLVTANLWLDREENLDIFMK